MSSNGPGPVRRPGPVTTFHGSDSRRSDGDRRLHQFSFRNSAAAPQYPREYDHYEPSRQAQRARQTDEYARDRRGPESNRRNEHGFNPRDRPQAQRSQRGRGNRHVATATRPLLSLKQSDMVEQMLGVSDDRNATKRFLHIDDITDSEEEQMEESDSDYDQSNVPVLHAAETDTAEPSLEPPAKRRAVGVASNESTDTRQVPKWSNPDPYTSLPPVDELRKRKDVVKLIRKARIAVQKDASVTNQAGINDDFISFGFEEIIATGESVHRSTGSMAEGHHERGLMIAPPTPKQFSHLQNLHGECLIKAPGAEDMEVSTDITGPPPGLEPRLRQDADTAILDTHELDYDNPLGSRKRTYDDVIKDSPERMARGKRALSKRSEGLVLDVWLPGVHSNPTPWLDRSAGRCENMGFRYASIKF